MPFVGDAADKLKRVAQKSFALNIAFRPKVKLRQLVAKPRRSSNVDARHVQNVVYKIPCKTCSMSYIGETSRPLLKRIAEHRSAVAKVTTGMQGSAVVSAFARSDCAVHTANGRYNEDGKLVKPFALMHELDFDFSKIEVVDRAANPHDRKFREAVHIIIDQPNFNRTCGIDVSPIYARLINDVAGSRIF